MSNLDDRNANPYEAPQALSEPVEETAEVYTLASRFVRLIAFVIDYAIVVSLGAGLWTGLAVLLALFTIGFSVPDSPPGPDAIPWFDTLFALTLLVVWVLYFACQESSRYRASVGKRLFRMEILRLDGDKLTFGRAAWRTIVKGFGAMIYFVGWIASLFNADRRALHDFAAGTVVVRRKAFGSKKETDPADELCRNASRSGTRAGPWIAPRTARVFLPYLQCWYIWDASDPE